MKRGTADLPLYGGKAPRWLFARMSRLAGILAELLVEEVGPAGFLERVSDPFWFQCLGCVLGFDWHSSGITTTTCGALKEGLRGRMKALGLFAAGGKGAASRKTPDEIRRWSDRAGTDGERLVYASRMSAKVDSSALQDGFQVYHHTFLFTAAGDWAVIQQGMNERTGRARRYHWRGRGVKDFVCEPHLAVCADRKTRVINLVAREAEACRKGSVEAGRMPVERLMRELEAACAGDPHLVLPERHRILAEDLHPSRLKRAFLAVYERRAEDFETLLGLPGVGAKTVRALALVSELLYGAPPSFRDPARFSFAHGGKDGIPYPVDLDTFDRTAALLEQALRRARVGDRERVDALRRLEAFLDRAPPPPPRHT